MGSNGSGATETFDGTKLSNPYQETLETVFWFDPTGGIHPELIQQFVAGRTASPKTVRNICVTLQSM